MSIRRMQPWLVVPGGALFAFAVLLPFFWLPSQQHIPLYIALECVAMGAGVPALIFGVIGMQDRSVDATLL